MINLINSKDFFRDKTHHHKGYIFYKTAKEFSLNTGDIITTDNITFYKIMKYISRRIDTKRRFVGYECLIESENKDAIKIGTKN